jgi:hypothetical protein
MTPANSSCTPTIFPLGSRDVRDGRRRLAVSRASPLAVERDQAEGVDVDGVVLALVDACGELTFFTR